ncbi:MAG: M28 family peptidase, partial [Clostridia bacterium]|nr:M28 family peptidase [Clostridia bacterium]
KIVLCEKGVGPAALERLLKAGARGYITYSGNLLYEDRDVMPKEYRFDGVAPLPAVHVHTADAFALAKKEGSEVEIVLEQSATLSSSHNLILDLEGEVDETVVVCAHYDSTPFSHGAYDNLSGAIGLLSLAEHFSCVPHRRRLRLLWCGSEEKGLLGSGEYARVHPRDNERTVLNINLDMLGSVLGDFVAFSCANEEMRGYLESFLRRHRFPGSTRLAIRSSDSNTFVHHGIPAVSFARYAPNFSYPVHTRYDTAQVVSAPRLLKDMDLIAAFTETVLNSDPVPLFICDEIKSEVEAYMKCRPRAVPERSL